MSDRMNADARVKLTLGTQFVELQLLQDQVDELRLLLARRDAEIGELKAAAASASPAAS